MNHKENNKKVWASLEDLTNESTIQEQDEFVNQENTSETSRRDFLKYMGFSLSAATVASCDIPIKKAIPYVVKPEEIVPGVATYYATSIIDGGDCLPALVKTREGRPIKIEGNKGMGAKTTFTKGGTSARAQAAVLSLYDVNRIQGPSQVAEGKAAEASWEDLDKMIMNGLASAKNINILSHTNNSPSFNKAMEQFKAKYPSAKFTQYDPISCSALIEANAKLNGVAGLPNYMFDKAMCVVGIEADFLGTWVSPVEFSADYIKNRKLSDADIEAGADTVMSTHIQFEAGMSLTGSNADQRVLIKPSERAAAVALLYKTLAEKMGMPAVALPLEPSFSWSKAAKAIEVTAEHLKKNAGKALVVCGINDLNIQIIVNEINKMIGAFGNTMMITADNHSKQRMGSDADLLELVSEMSAGKVDALILCNGANPAYDIPGMAADFSKALASVKTSVSLSAYMDETTSLCNFSAPDHHNLESWGDAEPKKGNIYLVQPTISPLFNTRSAIESLLTWSGQSTSAYDHIQNNWKNTFFSGMGSFQSFWQNALHDGFVNVQSPATETNTVVTEAAETTTDPVTNALQSVSQEKSSDLEVVFYESIQMGSGQFSNNPWLQEMPDPVMRTVWDNFIQIPIKWNGEYDYASLNDLKDGDLATITINGNEYTLPVFRQFGQMEGTISIALGYGRTHAGRAGNNVGTNLFPAVKGFNYASSATLSEKVGEDALHACVQKHHTYGITTRDENGATKMHTFKTGEKRAFSIDEHIDSFQSALTDRSVFFHATAKTVKREVEVLADKRKDYQYLNSKGLYPDRSDFYGMGHHWGMTVDLNSCTGCGACTVACMAENNVPVVGKFEVNNVHEMTWLRIDRYYYGNEETPNSVYMPMMCQHCDNAPCENVCPVAATNHSSEGVNQMTYNRCIGTRYCANNCPFKVRRFNWLDYTSADVFPSNEVDVKRGVENGESHMYMNENLTRMVLNPDVTVRSRGVIEKCSFCIQRIQEGKLSAKVEGRKLQDADVITACSQACPTGAITFGDDNDSNSAVYKLQRTKRSYVALEETNVRSSINYLMKVINKEDDFLA